MTGIVRRQTLTLAVLLSTLPGLALAAGNASRAQEKAAACAACHGADGNSPTADYPRIAGQHQDYLLRALLDYKSGKRKNPIMQSQVENLAKQDLADLAAYFAGQASPLFSKR